MRKKPGSSPGFRVYGLHGRFVSLIVYDNAARLHVGLDLQAARYRLVVVMWVAVSVRDSNDHFDLPFPP